MLVVFGSRRWHFLSAVTIAPFKRCSPALRCARGRERKETLLWFPSMIRVDGILRRCGVYVSMPTFLICVSCRHTRHTFREARDTYDIVSPVHRIIRHAGRIHHSCYLFTKQR